MAGPWNPLAIQVEMRYTQDGQAVENTLYFLAPVAPGVDDLNELGASLFTWYTAAIRPLQGNTVNLNEIYLRSLAGAVAAEYTTVVPQPSPGTRIGTPLPNNVTLAVSFRTGTTGRSARGRNYILGLVESDVDFNEVGGPVTEDWQDAYNELTTAGGAVPGYTWIVYSRRTAGAPRPTGVAFTIVTATIVNNIVDSQRRRLPGRGR